MVGRQMGTDPRMTGQVATADVDISASPGQVWTALTDPKLISKYMFGAEVETSWEVGTPIRWKGEYEGKVYEDKGKVVEVVPEERLTVTHFSPLTGQEDKPENYHTVTYEIAEEGALTHLTLKQDNNPTDEAAAESRANWETILNGLKEVVERG
jgi:uncharacterized protein YndB with AHSA1/START domain